jgi:S1-C subfamily serine protease
VLESFTANGRNIYNQGSTARKVYSVKADIQQGNSGGPLIDKDGRVIGVVFAKSINYNHVGYALTMDQVIAALNKAEGQTSAANNSSCTD